MKDRDRHQCSILSLLIVCITNTPCGEIWIVKRGAPIRWESFAHLDKKVAQEVITQKLESSILALKKWYEDGAQGIPP
jgi:hypothetical protein